MKPTGLVQLLLLGYLIQGSLADRHLFSNRHLLQPSSTDSETFPCSWDADKEQCVLSEGVFTTVQAALNGLFDHAAECGKKTSRDSCPANMCSWTGTECSAADFYFTEESIEVCFGEDLLEFILIPENSAACERKYTDEESCNDTKDCSWIDGDNERCGLNILKSFGLNGLLVSGAKVVASALGFTNASLRKLVAEWVNCKLESNEDGCLAEGRCEWDPIEQDCEMGFGAVAQIVNATFPVELSTTCLALKSIYRTGCPGYRALEPCGADDACKWIDDAGRCMSTNAAIEGEANVQADELSTKAGSTCMRVDKKEDCNGVTLAENNS